MEMRGQRIPPIWEGREGGRWVSSEKRKIAKQFRSCRKPGSPVIQFHIPAFRKPYGGQLNLRKATCSTPFISSGIHKTQGILSAL